MKVAEQGRIAQQSRPDSDSLMLLSLAHKFTFFLRIGVSRGIVSLPLLNQEFVQGGMARMTEQTHEHSRRGFLGHGPGAFHLFAGRAAARRTA
jgi:hypothetical protein